MRYGLTVRYRCKFELEPCLEPYLEPYLEPCLEPCLGPCLEHVTIIDQF